MKSLIKHLPIIIYPLLIIVAGWYFLLQQNEEVLFMAQLKSIFISDTDFWHQCMSVPGGALAWAGCWLTQLFYHTWIGVAALIAIWIATFLLLVKAYNMQMNYAWMATIPIVCLLVADIDLGYWLYYCKAQGYFFRDSLGVLYVALMLTVYRISDTESIKKDKTLSACLGVCFAIAVAFTYPLVGFYALVTLLCLAIREGMKRKWIVATATMLIAIAVPIMALQVYGNIRTEEAFYAGMPLFQSANAKAWHLSYPFFIITASLILFNFIPHDEKEKKTAWYDIAVQCIAVVIMGYIVFNANFTDLNYHKECKVYRCATEQDWDGVLGEAISISGPATREIIILKNIALMNNGSIGDEMFHYDNGGKPPFVNDSLQVHLVEFAAPLIYLHHGMTNFAIRWAIEDEVEFGLSADIAMVMVQSAIVNGEKELASKYLNVLSKTSYYKDWAARFQRIADGKTPPKKTKVLHNIAELHDHMVNILDVDQSLCEKYLINYFSGTVNYDSKYLCEMTLMYSLITQDIKTFWMHFFPYAEQHKGEQMPIHYQEAAYLYGILEPQTMDTSHMPFDEQRIKVRYADFNQATQSLLRMGMTNEEVGRQTETQFGDTFWWFYYFCRNKQMY